MSDLEVGRIGKPFGIRGEVYVHPDADLGDVIAPKVQLQTTSGETLTVRRAHWHGARFIVAFEGYTDRDQAERLRGQAVSVDRSLVELDEDTLWVADMVGTAVVDVNGQPVGTVAGVRDGTAHDWIVLHTTEGRDCLVPHVAQIIDVSQIPFVIDPPEGLLELE